jgi:hypothetical protein
MASLTLEQAIKSAKKLKTLVINDTLVIERAGAGGSICPASSFALAAAVKKRKYGLDSEIPSFLVDNKLARMQNLGTEVDSEPAVDDAPATAPEDISDALYWQRKYAALVATSAEPSVATSSSCANNTNNTSSSASDGAAVTVGRRRQELGQSLDALRARIRVLETRRSHLEVCLAKGIPALATTHRQEPEPAHAHALTLTSAPEVAPVGSSTCVASQGDCSSISSTGGGGDGDSGQSGDSGRAKNMRLLELYRQCTGITILGAHKSVAEAGQAAVTKYTVQVDNEGKGTHIKFELSETSSSSSVASPVQDFTERPSAEPSYRCRLLSRSDCIVDYLPEYLSGSLGNVQTEALPVSCPSALMADLLQTLFAEEGE